MNERSLASGEKPNPAAWIAQLADQLSQDFTYAVRGLGRNPGFTAAALATLALGIGATTAMFSVVQSVLLRPLPYADPGRLVTVWSELTRQGGQTAASGYANIADWRRASRTLAGVAAFDGTTVVIEDAGEARRAGVTLVSPNLFDVLGIQPLLGRAFTSGEAEQREALAVISHVVWRQRYGGSLAALDRPLVVNGRPEARSAH